MFGLRSCFSSNQYSVFVLNPPTAKGTTLKFELFPINSDNLFGYAFLAQNLPPSVTDSPSVIIISLFGLIFFISKESFSIKVKSSDIFQSSVSSF